MAGRAAARPATTTPRLRLRRRLACSALAKRSGPTSSSPVSAKAAGIRRHLDAKPLEAAPETVLYLARKALSRQQIAFAAVVTAVMSTAAAIAEVRLFKWLADGVTDFEVEVRLYLAYLPTLVGVGYLSQRLTAQPSVSEPLWRGLVVFPAAVLIAWPVWSFLFYDAFEFLSS